MANFTRTWTRPPTQEELDALIENFVREEVFYREALAMGLERGDPMVKRRMRMKLEMMLEDLSAQEITDDDLATYLRENPEKFSVEAQISFRQVYLNPDKRRNLEADAKRLLAVLNSGTSHDTLGDATLLPDDLALSGRSDIAATFGERFAEELMTREPGEWTGPVYSAYGAHLVNVSEHIEARQPDLREMRKLVEREYLVQLRNTQKELAYQKLRINYDVTVEASARTSEHRNGVIATTPAGQTQ